MILTRASKGLPTTKGDVMEIFNRMKIVGYLFLSLGLIAELGFESEIIGIFMYGSSFGILLSNLLIKVIHELRNGKC